MTNDLKGLPTELRLYEPPGNLVGVELGTYRPSEHKAIVQVAHSRGEVLSTDTLKISFKNAHHFKFPATTRYNQQGDVIVSQSRWRDGSIHHKVELLHLSGQRVKRKINTLTLCHKREENSTKNSS